MPRPATSLRAPSRRQRLLENPIAPASVNSSSATSGRRGGSCTPKLRWSVRESQEGVSEQKAPRASSVRRLAAAVWRLWPPEEAPAAEYQGKSRVGLEFIPRHLQVQLLRKDHLGHKHGLKVETSSPNSVLEQHSGELHKVKLHLASGLMPITGLENATNWKSESVKGGELDGAYVIANQLDLIEKQQGQTHANIIQMELQRAQDRVGKLEAERVSAKKQLDRLLEKLREEKATWRRREHKKAQSILEDMKADLDHEKKNRRQLENINLKLVDELKEVKLAANNLLEEYDKERKTREMTEEVCNKLVREVEEQKSDIEVLEQDFVKLREEVDEDRKLLQMAEVWREERVQMKLVDARLTLEDKYGELSKLQQDVEAFVASLGCAKGDSSILVREAEKIIREISLVRDLEVQFKYEPPAALEEILAIFKEIRPSQELGRCKVQRSSLDELEIQQASGQMADVCLENLTNRSPCQDSEIEDGSSWETTSHQDFQGSSFSRNGNGSEPSVNNVCDRISWTSGGNSEEVWQNDLSNIKVVEHEKKQSAISKFSRPCPRENHEIHQVDVEVDLINSLNRRMYYDAGEAADRGMGQSSPSMGPWSSPSPDSMNRGFRGCMELVQRHSLKAKLLEARMESQKIQLRRVLNHTT
ncbi:cilia- and flagella-associated protein 157-like [Triticum urartu]|nr:cilia- and flagella-associated protein 157-like [Triticum urartu]